MYFLYELLRDNITVVYENVEADKVCVFPPAGPCREISGRANFKDVPELKRETTAYLFDACAGENAREPHHYPAKLAIFTSPNEISYKQLQRSGLLCLTVPSYTSTELGERRKYFPNIDNDTYKRKIEQFGGGSIRLVLGLAAEIARDMVNEAIDNTTVSNMLDVIQHRGVGTNAGVAGPHVLFTTSLAPGRDPDDIGSYTRSNVVWNVASPRIMRDLICRGSDEAVRFASRASTVFQDTAGLQTTAGMFFESVAPAILAQGGVFRIRQLPSDRDEHEQWPTRNLLPSTNITNLQDMYHYCEDGDTVYYFNKFMPTFDGHIPPHLYFNCTTSDSHTISVKTAVEMCKQVSGADEKSKVRLYFVVPAHRFDSGWKVAQSFHSSNGSCNLSKLLNPKTAQESRKKLNISANDAKLLANRLEQYVLRLDLRTGGKSHTRVKNTGPENKKIRMQRKYKLKKLLWHKMLW